MPSFSPAASTGGGASSPPIEVLIRQVHQAHPTADEARHGKVFAERHEVPFDVDLRLVGQREQNVLVGLGFVLERDGAQDSEQQRAAVFGGPPPHGLEILADVLDRNRDRGLGPDDEVGAGALVRELGVGRQRRPQLLGLPLQLLRHGARRECDVERALLRHRERAVARREPAEPYGRDDRRGHRTLALRAEPKRQ